MQLVKVFLVAAVAILVAPSAVFSACDQMSHEQADLILNVWDRENPEQFEYYFQTGLTSELESLDAVRLRICRETEFVAALEEAERPPLQHPLFKTASENLILEHAVRTWAEQRVASPSEADLKKVFREETPEKFVEPEKWVLRYVEFPFEETGNERERTALRRAQSFLQQVTTSGTFREAADHFWQSRDGDGMLEPQPETVLRNTALSPALNMEDNEVTGPVRAKTKYVVFELQKRVPAKQLGFEQVRSQLELLWKRKSTREEELRLFNEHASEGVEIRAPFLNINTPPDGANDLLFEITGVERFTVGLFHERAPLIAAETQPDPEFFFGALYEHFRRAALHEPGIRNAARDLPVARLLNAYYRAGETARQWRLRHLAFLDNIKPADAERYYRDNIDRYRHPDRYWAKMLILAPAAAQNPADYLKLKDTLSAVGRIIHDAPDFERAAEQATSAGLRADVSEITGITSDEAGQAFELALPYAAVGQTTGPITIAKRQQVWLKIEKVQRGLPVTYEEVRSDVEQELIQERRKRTWEDLLETPALRRSLRQVEGEP